MDIMNSFSLKGKVALVTGGAYGIGFAIAEALAGAGAEIVFNCRSQKNLDQAMADYEAKGIKAHGYIADVTDEAQVQRRHHQAHPHDRDERGRFPPGRGH